MKDDNDQINSDIIINSFNKFRDGFLVKSKNGTYKIRPRILVFAILFVFSSRIWAITEKSLELVQPNSVVESDNADCPPAILIDALIPPDLATDMQANLAEVFPLWVNRYGLTTARWIRQMQIARLIIGEYGNKVLELIKAIKLAGS